MRRAAAAAFALLIPASALADGFTGFQVTRANYTQDNTDTSASPTAFVVRGGGFVNQHVSMEGRIGFGVADDTVQIGRYDVTAVADRLVSVLAKGHIPFGDGPGGLYGAVGYTDAKLTLTARGYLESLSDSGMSYGAGAEFPLGDRAGLNVEWMSYMDSSKNGIGYEFTAISAGFQTYF